LYLRDFFVGRFIYWRHTMALIDDIIDAATNDTVPIGTLLRKCLVLEQQVKNEKFKAWVNQELKSFFPDSDMVLNRAWQLIPGSVLVALVETVRNNAALCARLERSTRASYAHRR
jgi:hypothetical protein